MNLIKVQREIAFVKIFRRMIELLAFVMAVLGLGVS
jgi:hypothetical protein